MNKTCLLILKLIILFYSTSFINGACYERDLKFGDEQCLKHLSHDDIPSEYIINRKNCKEFACTEFFEDLHISICIQKKPHQISFITMHSSSDHFSIKDRFEISTFKDDSSYSVKKIALLGFSEKDLQVYIKIISLGALYQLKLKLIDLGNKNMSVVYLGNEDKLWQPLNTLDSNNITIRKDICSKTVQPIYVTYNLNVGFFVTLSSIGITFILLIAIIIILYRIKCNRKSDVVTKTTELDIQTPMLSNEKSTATMPDGCGFTNTDTYNTVDSQKLNSKNEQILNKVYENTETCGTENDSVQHGIEEMIEVVTTFSAEYKNFKSESLNWGTKQLISSGAFGNVYKCLYTKDNKCCYVAVKEPKSEFFEAFKEAEIMTRIEHPHILKLITTRMDENMILVMPLLRCSLLEFLYNNASRPNLTQKIRYCQQIAQGMAYLMFRQILHCDLKANNVLVVDENFVQISDLGKAHRRGSRKRTIGTITHTAKELLQAYDKKTLNCEATEVWSFGVTIWEIFNVTKQTPYADALKVINEFTIVDYLCAKNHLETNFWPSKETSESLITAESLMKRCLVHRQESRPSFEKLWQSFEEMLPEGQRLKYKNESSEICGCSYNSD